MTYQEFEQEYFNLISDPKVGNTYRLGQHFINKFIKDTSSYEMQKLWNEKVIDTARERIYYIIESYKWDWNDLPVLDKEI